MRRLLGNPAWRALSDDDPTGPDSYDEIEIPKPQEANLLKRIGLFSAARVQDAVRRALPLAPDEVRRPCVRAIRKLSRGRAGLPDYAVETMYSDYHRLGSLAKVGERAAANVAHGLRSDGKKRRRAA